MPIANKKFRTRNSSDDFWKGFARQTIDFHNALGELVDNSLSARRERTVGDGFENAVIEITLRELDDGTIRTQVADAGTGVDWTSLTGKDNIFNLGYQPKLRGKMNEHGFGLKNALALLTSGFTRGFTFFSKAESGDGDISAVIGPLGEEMEAGPASQAEWEDDLDVLQAAESGVKVCVDVNPDYFRTVYRRGANFDTLVRRLGEHLGVMYASFLEEGNQIHLRYRSKKAAKWTAHKVPAISTPFLRTKSAAVSENEIKVTVDGEEYSAVYRQGRLDSTVKKDGECPDEWPYPLKIHFQGSNARCGLSYVVRGRVLKTGVFQEIWPEKAGDVSFNNFLGELRVGKQFKTTNNKTDLDPHSPIWKALLDKIAEDFPPEKITKRTSEENLRKSVIKQLSTVHKLNGANKPHHLKTWGGYAEIDIFYKIKKEIFIVETKVGQADIQALYQLVMYWDGLVADGKKPTRGTLIADSIPQPVAAALASLNKRSDAKGNAYVFDIQTTAEWGGVA